MVVHNQSRHDWLLLLIAAVLLGNATLGVVKGELVKFYGPGLVSKADDSLLYWISMVISITLAVICVIYFFI